MELQELIEALSSWELTVREQARTAENDPTMTHPLHFPDNEVDSVKLADITIVDVRYIGDRREWNADGRLIPAKKPAFREFEMVPLEQYFVIGEREMQELGERFNGNKELIIEAAKASIPRRIESLTNANIWATEYESLRAWAENKIVVMNPQTGKVYEASMQVDTDRYITDATTWTDSNAYDRFLKYAEEALEYIGAVGGARVRRTTASLIQKSAPRLTTSAVRMTMTEINQRLSDELGTEFEIIVDERAAEKFDGAGQATTMTKLWPQDVIGFFPPGYQVGDLNKAPQFRAGDLPQVVANFEGFDQRGQRIYFEPQNSGKALKVQAQANWLPIPREQRTFVVNITRE